MHVAKTGMVQRSILCLWLKFYTHQVSKSATKSIGRTISPPRINPFHEQPPRSAPRILRCP
ncbi:hypothetical protein BO443_100081 [Burkholderia orbicola]